MNDKKAVKKEDMELFFQLMDLISIQTVTNSITWTRKDYCEDLESYISLEYEGLIFEIIVYIKGSKTENYEYIFYITDMNHCSDCGESIVIQIDTRDIERNTDKRQIKNRMLMVFNRAKQSIGYSLFIDNERKIITDFVNKFAKE